MLVLLHAAGQSLLERPSAIFIHAGPVRITFCLVFWIPAIDDLDRCGPTGFLQLTYQGGFELAVMGLMIGFV